MKRYFNSFLETNIFRQRKIMISGNLTYKVSHVYYFPMTEIITLRKLSEAAFGRMLQNGLLRIPPLSIKIVSSSRDQSTPVPDAIIDVTLRGKSCRYVAELKRDAKPPTLKLAMDQAKERARRTSGARPMVIAPHFSGEKLEQLLEAGVSALDFCGNAVVDAPGKFLFYKTGNPNRFPDSSPIRSAYRGDSSLVARVFLLQREFQAISDIAAAIKKYGCSLTLGAVSKVLQRLESDLVIERPSRKITRLIQPDKLLDQLLDAYQPPKIECSWLGKVALPNADLLNKLEQLASNGAIIRTGAASAGEYAAFAAEPIIVCYCTAVPAALLGRLGCTTKETTGFPNLQLIQTMDQRVYFDRRPRLAASPIQSWLEMATGDKRQKETAEQIRNVLLNASGAAS